MKKGVIITTAILSFFIITVKSNAEMKITPSGVTSPDDLATIHLHGSLTTGNLAPNPSGAIISGVNAYSGDFYSYGGYFQSSAKIGAGVYGTAAGLYGNGVYGHADGVVGNGVYGQASGNSGIGIYGKSSGAIGRGVYGIANNPGTATNYGGYFVATGSDGRGVYGSASNSGPVANYGGYFEAAGIVGTGVYGLAGYTGNVTNWGGYFEAKGAHGTGVFGFAGNNGNGVNYGGQFIARGDYGRGVWGQAQGASGYGVYGHGGEWDFYADGPGGNYGPFTGAHEVKFAQDIPEEILPGMIVSVTGKTAARKDKNGVISLSSTLPTVTISTKSRDKAVFGVLVSDGPLPKNHWYKTEDANRFGVVNALGEGRVWVTDINGQIQTGDYITTSSVPGYGQMQDDDFLHSYTLGKAIETIDWEQVTETVEHNGESHKRYLIAIVYTSG
jgi:hypothetical protein